MSEEKGCGKKFKMKTGHPLVDEMMDKSCLVAICGKTKTYNKIDYCEKCSKEGDE